MEVVSLLGILIYFNMSNIIFVHSIPRIGKLIWVHFTPAEILPSYIKIKIKLATFMNYFMTRNHVSIPELGKLIPISWEINYKAKWCFCYHQFCNSLDTTVQYGNVISNIYQVLHQINPFAHMSTRIPSFRVDEFALNMFFQWIAVMIC